MCFASSQLVFKKVFNFEKLIFNMGNVSSPHYPIIRYKDSEQNETMAVLDIGLPTGFIANSRDLDLVRT